MYLRLSVTDACDFRCWYCRPVGSGPVPAAGPPLGREAILALISALHRAAPLSKIRLTGGEPLLRPDLEEIVEALRALVPEAELTLTTNGSGLELRATGLRAAGLDRINVSLDSVDPARFAEITGRDALEKVKRGVLAARAAGFAPPKLNAVLLRHGAGAEMGALLDFAASQGSELRFIELMPFGPAKARFQTEFLPMAEALDRLRKAGGYLGPLPSSATAQRHLFQRHSGEVVVGFIPSVTEPFCARCDRLRLDARGRLFPCLRRERGLDLTPLLPAAGQPLDEAAFAEAVHGMLAAKGLPDHHWPARSLAGIGG
ncbi:MAG: radical SAM protein [Polyangia bacterium]|nr:radical SAM protein [Polyangia bacterium]